MGVVQERTYKTSVTHIGMIGSVGTWRGNFVGGKIIDCTKNPLEHMSNVDTIEVVIRNGIITINGYHHDGMHSFDLYLLTENKFKKYAPDFLTDGYYTHEDLSAIKENTAALRHYTVKQKSYFNVA